MTHEAEEILADLRAARWPSESLTISMLAARHHWPRRVVEACVQELRLAGIPVVTDQYGVHLSDDPDEVTAAAEGLRRRLVTQYAGLRALRRTARRMRVEGDAKRDMTLWGQP